MAYNYEYPYTDPNRYNADWLINLVKMLKNEVSQLNDTVKNFLENLDIDKELEEIINKKLEDGSLYDFFSSILFFVTPQMFGAKGDGIQDDTVAFRLAIKSLQNGGMLYIPDGTYIISETGITITNTMSMIGASTQNTIIKSYNTTANIAIDADNVTLKNFTLDGNNVLNSTAVSIYKKKNCVIDSVNITNINAIGIGLSNAYKCIVRNCSIIGVRGLQPAYWCGYDDDFDGEHGWHIYDNVYAYNIGLDGIICNDDYVDVLNSKFVLCGTLTPTGGALGACGIYTDANIRKLYINNCICSENSESGIDITRGNFIRISNCMCENNGLGGIAVRDVREVVIENNTLIQNGNNPTTSNPYVWSHSGIAFTPKSSKVRIVNNASYDTRSGIAQTQKFGIEYLYQSGVDTSHASQIIVIGNNLKYNKTDTANLGTGYPDSDISGLIYENLND